MAKRMLEEAETQGDAKRTASVAEEMISFSHAPLAYFALDKLTPKGRRKNVDQGDPHDASRSLAKVGNASVGSWSCTEGGWVSAEPRKTTEVFHALAGEASVTDADGEVHRFGPGDTVMLPKGWSGRWDIAKAFHKICVVHDHGDVEGASLKAQVVPLDQFKPEGMTPQGVRKEVAYSTPTTTSREVYSVGTTSVGCWTCTAGGFPVKSRPTTEILYVLEGLFFLTNADGSAHRCEAGDTVVLPKGWSGHWDIIETVKKVWIDVAD